MSFLPEAEDQFPGISSLLKSRMDQIDVQIQADRFKDDWIDSSMELLLNEGFVRTGADEGSIWLFDRESNCLRVAFNSGPRAEKIVREVRQPLDTGNVCMVFLSEQEFLENSIVDNVMHSKIVDEKLSQVTQAMMAVPLYFSGRVRGVISCVILENREDRPDSRGQFSPDNLASLNHLSVILSRLIDLKTISRLLGWE